MVKFGRNYQLTIEGPDGNPIIIEPPFTLEFNTVRNNLASVNNGVFRIYNLAPRTRALIRKDRNDFGNIRRIHLDAGYGKNLSTVFDGTITYAWSVREGVNFITQVQAFDNGDAMVNGKFNGHFAANTPTETILQTIIADMPSVKVGSIGSYPNSTTRGKSYSGNSMNLLSELSGGGAFIDNGLVHVLGDNECIANAAVTIIDSDGGLLNTPVREERVLTFDMIFEPGLVVGQKVTLESATGSNFNGTYKIVGLAHRAMISPATCGEAITSVNVWYGLKALTVVPNA